MPRSPVCAALWWRGPATAIVLVTANCTSLPATSSVTIPPLPAGEARLWIYRDGGPRDAQQRPYLRLNGQIAGISEPNGTLYRDVSPGHYKVTVDSYTGTYFDQFADINLAAGQEAYIEVPSQGQRVGGETGTRVSFFTRAVPAEVARPEATRRPFYGGS
jgi:hypothetical protein